MLFCWLPGEVRMDICQLGSMPDCSVPVSSPLSRLWILPWSIWISLSMLSNTLSIARAQRIGYKCLESGIQNQPKISKLAVFESFWRWRTLNLHAWKISKSSNLIIFGSFYNVWKFCIACIQPVVQLKASIHISFCYENDNDIHHRRHAKILLIHAKTMKYHILC